ncbi:MAG: YlcI/YnfO family protein [Ruminococcus sp.]
MKKFKIPQMPQTTSKSIRFPNDVIDEVESALVGTDCTFSAFVVEAVRVALENLKEDEEESSDQY